MELLGARRAMLERQMEDIRAILDEIDAAEKEALSLDRRRAPHPKTATSPAPSGARPHPAAAQGRAPFRPLGPSSPVRRHAPVRFRRGAVFDVDHDRLVDLHLVAFGEHGVERLDLAEDPHLVALQVDVLVAPENARALDRRARSVQPSSTSRRIHAGFGMRS